MAGDKKPFARLPKSVKPVLYDLFLKPDLQNFTFEGKETVSINILESTKEIVLHALDLKIEEVELKDSDGLISKPSVTLSAEDETVTLGFDTELKIGEAFLKFIFVGELNDKMKGFYRSKYVSPSGEEKYSAVTQFEATDARRCFPCWDEPAIKAEFNILLSVPQNKTALSNMPVVSDTTEENGDRLLKFQKTPIMSTYLVAVVVGDFDYVEDTDSDGVLVRVYTPIGKSEQGKFALEVAKCALPYYKDYFQVAYPLPKMDLIAIADFSSGAMENWGLVTYRESCLLVDPDNTSAVRKQWIALVVGHELAHQWFGNLVTMEWWTHLWLNEGYASFVEFLCVEHLFPEYDIWTQFVTDTYIRALELDALNSSHPIEIPVGHPSEIDEIFDDISYNKGASVIRMLHNFIGDQDFRKGMNLYLNKHQYSNTFTEDLWAALEEASNKPVKDVMSTWTLQMGGGAMLPLFTSTNSNNCFTTLPLPTHRDSNIHPPPSLSSICETPFGESWNKNRCIEYGSNSKILDSGSFDEFVEKGSPYYETVFGSVPSRWEVEKAMSDLQSFNYAPKEEMNWAEPMLVKSPGNARFYDALYMLQNEPSIQRLVCSIACDRAVWEAMMSNKAVQNLQGSVISAGLYY